jgi:hypothetical protein
MMAERRKPSWCCLRCLCGHLWRPAVKFQRAMSRTRGPGARGLFDSARKSTANAIRVVDVPVSAQIPTEILTETLQEPVTGDEEQQARPGAGYKAHIPLIGNLFVAVATALSQLRDVSTRSIGPKTASHLRGARRLAAVVAQHRYR